MLLSFRHLGRKARLGLLFINCYCCKIAVCRSSWIVFSVWTFIVRNKFRLFRLATVLFLLFLSIPWRSLKPDIVKKILQRPGSEKIVIGLMSCAGGIASTGRGKNETRAMLAAAEEPLTLIKSVLISAKVSGAKRVDFHIVTDSWMLKATLRSKIEEFNKIMKDFVKMSVYFYSAFEAVPRNYERDFVDNVRRCGFVRVFFPNSLPTEVKEILYLDTDTIITGNIVEIWNNFKEKVVTNSPPNRPRQLAALIQNSEVYGNTYLDVYKDHFQWIQHVPPRGVNSGVMFMNLDAMREFNWTEKILKLFRRKRNTLWGDQQLINMIFHQYLDRNVTTDPGGIYIMHGAGGLFHMQGRSHAQLFRAYKTFQLERHQDVEKELFIPLRNHYSKQYNTNTLFGRVSCYGYIGKYLFKQLIKIK